jgi:glycyl-tRNA synthetase beta chain
MIADANFLCEIGTEEIPAGYLLPAVEAIKKYFGQELDELRISHGDIEVMATPRRLAILISGLAGSQREEEVELKGPSAKAAYDGSGKPTKALDGFMKGNGLVSGDISTRTTDKGEYVFAKKKLESKSTESVLPQLIEKAVRNVTFPKRMRWSDKSVTYPRPIAYFLILFNDRVVPFEIEGVASSNKTRGHYIQHDRMIEIGRIKDYVRLLGENGVIIDHNERKRIIKEKIEALAASKGYILYEDEDLLNTVTFLVECPYPLICDFDKSFLSVPEPVLIAEMKEHQKYFALMDRERKLINQFIVVANNPPTDNIKAGNERVITARFNDARFFNDEDRKVKLIDRVDSLKSVLFHKELGSIYDKIERMRLIAGEIGNMLKLDDKARKKIDQAVLLSKTDLVTMVVFEFTSLQGRIGRIYALNDGEEKDVADAIDDHYKPRFQGDPLPTATTSVVVSIAEKIDNIFGSFSVGNIPKGSHDPYALRRQANAVVELLIQNNIKLSMKELLVKASGSYRKGMELVDELVAFISARAKTIFTDKGFRHDVVDACLSTDKYDYYELFRIAASLHEFRKNEKFSAMLLGFKRMNNIVSAFRKENGGYELKFNPSLFSEPEEKDLYSFFDTRTDLINTHLQEGKYIELYELIIEGKSIIDSFFDKVLVMDKNVEIRDNRLFILESILKNFKSLLDFSKLEDVK